MSDELKVKNQSSNPPRHPSLVTRHPSAGTVLAFDFGTRRIGVAVGDFETRLAHPLATLDVAENRARFASIERLITEWRPALLVVGLPAREDGSEHPVGKLARRFAQRLQGRFGVRAELVDEHLTSHDAEHSLRSAGARGARLKAGLDAVAAQRILETYFEKIRESGRS
jgi:putative Holliday junction resolvase